MHTKDPGLLVMHVIILVFMFCYFELSVFSSTWMFFGLSDPIRVSNNLPVRKYSHDSSFLDFVSFRFHEHAWEGGKLSSYITSDIAALARWPVTSPNIHVCNKCNDLWRG